MSKVHWISGSQLQRETLQRLQQTSTGWLAQAMLPDSQCSRPLNGTAPAANIPGVRLAGGNDCRPWLLIQESGPRIGPLRPQPNCTLADMQCAPAVLTGRQRSLWYSSHCGSCCRSSRVRWVSASRCRGCTCRQPAGQAPVCFDPPLQACRTVQVASLRCQRPRWHSA